MNNSNVESIGWGIKIVTWMYIILNIVFIIVLAAGLVMEAELIDTVRNDISLTTIQYQKILYTGIFLSLVHISCGIMILKRMKLGVIIFYAVAILSTLYDLIIQGDKFNLMSVIFPAIIGVFIYRKRHLYGFNKNITQEKID